MSDTIFMIHGMWGGKWYWEGFKAYFEDCGYDCRPADLKYHDIGPDDPPPPGLGETGLRDYADDLEDRIRQLGEKPIIMGHSMGGLLAQILASRGLAKAAVLITPASPAGIMAIRPSVLKCFLGILFRWKTWKRPHKMSYEKAVYGMMEKLPPQDRRRIYDQCVWESGRAAFEIGFWMLGFEGPRVDASTVTCPILVIAGSDDHITPAKVVRKVAEKYRPCTTYMEFSGHAHSIIHEPGREKVAALIHTWLKENA